MSLFRKPLFLVLLLVLLVGGAGVGLYFTGNLPLGQSANGTDVAAADTLSVEDEAEDDKPEVMPVPVELAQAQAHGISSYYRAASVIEADRLVDLTCRSTGRVQKILVEEGDWVEQGTVLAELENDREKIQVRKADLTLADKKRLLDRNREMLAGELISRQEFDDVESGWKLAEAERDLARLVLEETRIRAAFAGRVTDRKIVTGQQVTVGAPAFTLGDFDPLRVRVNLPEIIARKVSAGQRVIITPEGLDKALDARVERISPVVDPATSTVRLTLQLDDGKELAQVGGFAKVRITTDSHHDALSIPKLALVEEGALRSVFVAVADTVRKVEIKTGLYDESHVEILEGLNDGDFIVTMGQGGLRTGTLINALNGKDLGYESPNSDLDNPDTVTAMVERD
jgi:membrane fusion protein, multidrug efflux system